LAGFGSAARKHSSCEAEENFQDVFLWHL
jgi:hypothetical protein